MHFFSNFFNFGSLNIKKLEKQADDILELPNDYKAYRLKDEVLIVDASNKLIEKIKDVLPTNHVRATLELIKKFNLTAETEKLISKKSSDVWTCGFREDESRWVWYQNSEPRMTANFNDVYKNGSLEDKVDFYSARYGTSIINDIKIDGLEKTAKKINALVLETPYVRIKCSHCLTEENYTIDDLVDQQKNPKYDSNLVICQNCNEFLKLI